MLLTLFGATTTHYNVTTVEQISSSLAINPQTVSCFDNSFNVCHDSTLDIASPIGMPVNRNLQLALTRICISESGFQVRTNDCTMIYHALRTRSSTGEITLGIMRAYAPQSFNIHRTDNHRWIAHLRIDAREPIGWRETTTISWSTRKEGFQQVWNHVGMLLRTRPENSCGIRIDHWGARYFRRRTHIRNGWIPIQCGETLNQFWSLPN